MSDSNEIPPDFALLDVNLGVGQPVPAGWMSITTQPLIIVVGVTGVGKSTIVDAVRRRRPLRLLPNRRTLTDRLIIGLLQRADGDPVTAVADRQARFAYTRRYRERYPGGMGHALAQLQIGPAGAGEMLIFDGLRGENEVTHAQEALPMARFVVLEAPDAVRVERLLGRQDRFDQVAAAGPAPSTGKLATFADLGIPEAATLFDTREAQTLLGLVDAGAVTAEELLGKLKIVVAERRSYDPDAACAALLRLAPERTLVIDTVTTRPEAAVQTLLGWLESQEISVP